MKIEATYQVTYYYDDVDLTEEEFNSMTEQELSDFADDLKECAHPDREEQDGMVSCTYRTDKDVLLKEI